MQLIYIFYFSDLSETIENVWLQVKAIITSKLQEEDENLTSENENTLKDQILLLANEDGAVRKLMWKRLIAYVRLVKLNPIIPPVPPGYTDITEELQTLANTFRRLTVYNYSVFGDHCEKLLEGLSEPSSKIGTQSEGSNETIE